MQIAIVYRYLELQDTISLDLSKDPTILQCKLLAITTCVQIIMAKKPIN